MSGVTIRPATPDDIDTMVGLISQMAEYEKLTHQLSLSAHDLNEALFGSQPAAFAEVAVRNGQIVGQAIWFFNFSTFLGKKGIWLEDIIVDQAHRRQGIGTALFNHMLQKAKQENVGRLEFSVLDWNRPAIRFYQKYGTEIMSDWRICRLDKAALERVE